MGSRSNTAVEELKYFFFFGSHVVIGFDLGYPRRRPICGVKIQHSDRRAQTFFLWFPFACNYFESGSLSNNVLFNLYSISIYYIHTFTVFYYDIYFYTYTYTFTLLLLILLSICIHTHSSRHRRAWARATSTFGGRGVRLERWEGGWRIRLGNFFRQDFPLLVLLIGCH